MSHSDFQNQKGFTLIEIMVVLVIITAIVTMVLPKIGNQNNQLKEVIRRFTVLSREIRHRARLENATFRLVIDMKDGWESGQDHHQYWVEKTFSQVRLSGNKKDEAREEIDEEGQPIDPDGFVTDESIMKSASTLPSPLWFEDVEVNGNDHPIKEGKAYIYFFPEGLVQEAAVHFRMSDKAQWTLFINPLTGKSDIITQRLELKDIRDQ